MNTNTELPTDQVPELDKSGMITSAIGNYELLLHHLFIKNPKLRDEASYLNGLILFYTIGSYFFTPRQLVTFFIRTDSRNFVKKREALEIRLRRMAEKKYLNDKVFYVRGGEEKIYTVSEAGARYCLSQIEGIINKEKDKDIKSWNDTAAIFNSFKTEQYTYMKNRAITKTNIQNFDHHIASRDFNLYLLTNKLTNINYSYDTEVGIMPDGKRQSKAEVALDYINKVNMPALKSDAVIDYPTGDILYTFYMEQDTGEQRKNAIQKKIINYLDNKFPFETDLSVHSLLFSIFIPRRMMRKRENLKDNNPSYSAMRSYTYGIDVVTRLSFKGMSLGNIRVSDLINVYRDICNEGDNRKITNQIKWMEKVLCKYPDISVEGLYKIVEDNRSGDGLSSAKALTQRMHERYISRRESIFKWIYEMDAVKELMSHGLSIFAAHNSEYGEIIPQLLPELFHLKNKLTMLVSSSMAAGDSIKNVSFSSMSTRNGKDGNILKNHYLYNDTIHLYVENISDDLGGRHRVKKYLDSPYWENEKGVLLCLVSETDMNIASSLYMGTSYQSTSSSPSPHPLSSAGSLGTLKVYFLKYMSERDMTSLFTFDTSGNAIKVDVIEF